MAKVAFCWRCQADVPMLDEAEWALVSRALADDMRDLAAGVARLPPGLSDTEKTAIVYRRTLDLHFRFTGVRETNPSAIGHHVLALYGPPCAACAKPLRSPRARFCAACGTPAGALD